MANVTSRVAAAPDTVAGTAWQAPPLPTGYNPYAKSCPGFGRCSSGITNASCTSGPIGGEWCVARECRLWKNGAACCAHRPMPKRPCGAVACGAYVNGSSGTRVFDAPHTACYRTTPLEGVLFCADNAAASGACPAHYASCRRQKPPARPPALPIAARCPPAFCKCCQAGIASATGGGQYNVTTCGWTCSARGAPPAWCFTPMDVTRCGEESDASAPLDPCKSPLCGTMLPPYPKASDRVG